MSEAQTICFAAKLVHVIDREVTIRGRKGVQHIAETSIILDRPATKKVNGKATLIPGDALQSRHFFNQKFTRITQRHKGNYIKIYNYFAIQWVKVVLLLIFGSCLASQSKWPKIFMISKRFSLR